MEEKSFHLLHRSSFKYGKNPRYLSIICLMFYSYFFIINFVSPRIALNVFN